MKTNVGVKESRRQGQSAIMVYVPMPHKEKLVLASKLTGRTLTDLLEAVATKIHLILPLLDTEQGKHSAL